MKDKDDKGHECKMDIDRHGIAEVKKLEYLGVMLNGSGSCDDEIEQRLEQRQM